MQYFIISFSLCFACSVIVFCFIVNLRLTLFTLGMTDASIVLLSLTHKVWVVGFEEPLTCSLLVLLHLLLGVRSHLLMHLDVAGDAQQLAIGGIVTPCTHSVWSFDRLGLLDGSDVMHVHTSGDEALGLAPLAQAVGTAEHLSPQQLPLLVVQ